MGYRREYYDSDELNLELNDNNMKMELKCSRPRETGPVTANYEHLKLSVKIDIDTARKISNLVGCMSFTATETVQVDAMDIDVNWYITIDRKTNKIIFSLELPVISDEAAEKDPEIFETPLFRALTYSEHKDIVYMIDGANDIVNCMYKLLIENALYEGHMHYATQQNKQNGII